MITLNPYHNNLNPNSNISSSPKPNPNAKPNPDPNPNVFNTNSFGKKHSNLWSTPKEQTSKLFSFTPSWGNLIQEHIPAHLIRPLPVPVGSAQERANDNAYCPLADRLLDFCILGATVYCVLRFVEGNMLESSWTRDRGESISLVLKISNKNSLDNTDQTSPLVHYFKLKRSISSLTQQFSQPCIQTEPYLNLSWEVELKHWIEMEIFFVLSLSIKSFDGLLSKEQVSVKIESPTL